MNLWHRLVCNPLEWLMNRRGFSWVYRLWCRSARWCDREVLREWKKEGKQYSLNAPAGREEEQ